MNGSDRNTALLIVLIGLVAVVIVVLVWGALRRKLGRSVSLISNFNNAINAVEAAEFSKQSTITVNDIGVITYINKRVKVMFGYDEDDLVGTERMSKLMPVESMEPYEKFKLFHSGQDDDANLEIDMKNRKDKIFPAEVSIWKWQLPADRNRWFYTIIIRDISHRRDNEEVKRIAQAEINRITTLCMKAERILGSGGWSWYLSGNGNVDIDEIRYTTNFATILGILPNQKFYSRQLLDMIFEDDVDVVKSALLSLQTKDCEVDFRLRGSKRLIRCKGTRIKNENDNLIRIDGVIQLI